jgi:hypothetical protein
LASTSTVRVSVAEPATVTALTAQASAPPAATLAAVTETVKAVPALATVDPSSSDAVSAKRIVFI